MMLSYGIMQQKWTLRADAVFSDYNRLSLHDIQV